MKRDLAISEVYKKRVEQMADIQAELAQTQEHNRKLYADIDMLKTDYEKTQFKEMIAQLQKELMSAKLKLD